MDSKRIEVDLRVGRDGSHVRYRGDESVFGQVMTDVSVLQTSIPIDDRVKERISISEHKLRFGMGLFCLIFAISCLIVAGARK